MSKTWKMIVGIGVILGIIGSLITLYEFVLPKISPTNAQSNSGPIPTVSSSSNSPSPSTYPPLNSSYSGTITRYSSAACTTCVRSVRLFSLSEDQQGHTTGALIFEDNRTTCVVSGNVMSLNGTPPSWVFDFTCTFSSGSIYRFTSAIGDNGELKGHYFIGTDHTADGTFDAYPS